MFTKLTSIGFSVSLLISSALGAKRPNVVVIMTDDQGYGDLSITGNTLIQTPHMDRLAKEGSWLKQFYVSPVCTPTRAHLMTGRYAYRTRAIDTYLGRAVMEPEEVTIAEVLSAAGYETGIFGKWHLGDYYPTRATDQGFRESLVHLGGGLRQPANPPEGERYHDPILFHNGKGKRYEGYCTDIFFDEAANYIEQKSKAAEPFFVYLATNAPHGPFDEPPTRDLYEEVLAKLPNESKVNKNKAAFYSMIKNVDNNIGRLTKKIKDLGIDDNTIVIFLTDNGPVGFGSAGPFRGSKTSAYQGGIRTVCFARWPGKIEAGSSVNFTSAHIDLMPTILDFCGVKKPEGVELDGRSVRPLIPEIGVVKPQGWEDRHLFLQWHRGDEPRKYENFAAIDPAGDWKLVNARGRNSTGKLELYQLSKDIGEKNNLAAKHPEIVAKLKAEYDRWFDDVTTTRSPNFGMPPIVIGSEKQEVVVLTPQDKRVDQGAKEKGWQTPGSWPVTIENEGPYTISIRLIGIAAQATPVDLQAKVNGKIWKKQIIVPAGVHSMAIGDITFPGKGGGKFVAKVGGGNSEGNDVYQVTVIKSGK